MRHTPALFTALLGAALLAGCGQTPHQPDATAPSPNALRLQHTYEQQKELLGIHPGDEYEITDVTTGLTYSEQHGFRTTELVTVNSRGVATLSSGTSIALTPERGYAAQSVNTQAVCESTTYCPFTRVESLSGYRKISGDLYLPYSVSGLSGGGATYNYFGMRTATQNVELGFYADYQAPSTFYVYIRYKNSAGQDTFAGQQVPSGVLEDDVAHLTPLLHEHVNMLGKYDFTLPEEIVQGQLRRLRDPNTLEAYLEQIEL